MTKALLHIRVTRGSATSAALETRVEAAFRAFVAWTEGWPAVDEVRGTDVVLAAYRDVLRGGAAPDVARVAAL